MSTRTSYTKHGYRIHTYTCTCVSLQCHITPLLHMYTGSMAVNIRQYIVQDVLVLVFLLLVSCLSVCCIVCSIKPCQQILHMYTLSF